MCEPWAYCDSLGPRVCANRSSLALTMTNEGKTLLQRYVHVMSFQSCMTLCNPMDYSLPDSSGMGREEGGGFRMGNTCIPVADSF